MMRRQIRDLPRKQKGAVMVFSLIILVGITILVLGMVNTTTNEFIVVGNQQSKKKIDDAAREAIELTLNNQTQFTNAIAGSAVDQTYTVNGYTVTVTKPYCYGAKNPPGYSSLSAVAPEDTHWVITATAKDAATGAQTVITQGVKIRLGAGNCGITF